MKTASIPVYIGTYTNPKTGGKGIYLVRLDMQSGSLSRPELAGEAPNPSFLALHPNGRFLYAVSEAGKGGSAARSFAVDPATGKLNPLNQQPAHGDGACHVTVDLAGKNVLIANYSTGSAAVFPVAADGTLGEATSVIQHRGHGTDPKRQDGPHAHEVCLDPAGRFAFIPDLGLDRVYIYRLDSAAGVLAPNDPPAASVAPGSGPRHIAFRPDARFAYVITEMASTVTAFTYDAHYGSMGELQTLSTLPDGFSGRRWGAAIQVHPSGKFLYASNRGHDSVALFGIDTRSGKLTLLGHTATRGNTPRDFAIDPSGAFLIAANQDSSTLVVFRIDPGTGALTAIGAPVEVPSPVCVLMPPGGA